MCDHSTLDRLLSKTSVSTVVVTGVVDDVANGIILVAADITPYLLTNYQLSSIRILNQHYYN